MMFFLLEYGSGFGYCLIMKAERLSEVISDVEYMYDSSGRRTCSVRSQSGTTSTNYYIYDGIQCVADTDSSGNLLRSYTWGPGVDNLLAMTVYTGSVVRTYYALTDHLGTVHALTDSSGNIVESYKYDAWGRVLSIEDNLGNQLSESALGNRYLWQGREYSYATGLYNFRARWYDPVTGRWLSKDPIGISGGLNQYVFVENNPVNARDPLGLVDINLFAPHSVEHQLADNLNATDGSFSVGAHGTAHSVIGPEGESISPRELAKLILDDERYKPGKKVTLASCNTGKGRNSYAEQLAKALTKLSGIKTQVKAPDAYMWFRPIGGVCIKHKNGGGGPGIPGRWRTF